MEILDATIEQLLNWLGNASENDPRCSDATAMMEAGFIWKSYLLALNTKPANWGIYMVCPLSALKVLTTADSAQVIGRIRDGTNGLVKNFFDAAIRNGVRDNDWPPRAYVDLYLRNRERLENECRALFAPTYTIEQAARNNALLRRQELEQTPRISSTEIARNAAHFTMEGAGIAYNTMRRDDFCDVILTRLKAGNLSDSEATPIVFIREWVLSDGDRRLSFPEWLAAEGHQRIAGLTREWLRSGVDRRMSFNEWYIRHK